MKGERVVKPIKTVTEALAHHTERAPITEKLVLQTPELPIVQFRKQHSSIHPSTHILSIFNELDIGHMKMLKKRVTYRKSIQPKNNRNSLKYVPQQIYVQSRLVALG